MTYFSQVVKEKKYDKQLDSKQQNVDFFKNPRPPFLHWMRFYHNYGTSKLFTENTTALCGNLPFLSEKCPNSLEPSPVLRHQSAIQCAGCQTPGRHFATGMWVNFQRGEIGPPTATCNLLFVSMCRQHESV